MSKGKQRELKELTNYPPNLTNKTNNHPHAVHMPIIKARHNNAKLHVV